MANGLEALLLQIAREHYVRDSITTSFGTKYVVEGAIRTPTGQNARLCTVWIVEPPDDRPRFVTAFPL